jgi:hypothetical protein
MQRREDRGSCSSEASERALLRDLQSGNFAHMPFEQVFRLVLKRVRLPSLTGQWLDEHAENTYGGGSVPDLDRLP